MMNGMIDGKVMDLDEENMTLPGCDRLWQDWNDG